MKNIVLIFLLVSLVPFSIFYIINLTSIVFSSKLMSFICELVESSTSIQQQVIAGRTLFYVFSYSVNIRLEYFKKLRSMEQIGTCSGFVFAISHFQRSFIQNFKILEIDRV